LHQVIKRVKMKKGFLISALLFSLVMAGQPALKLYGFSRVSTPGMVPAREFDENGRTINKPANESIGYFIYLAANASLKIQPREIWIMGKRYTVSSAPVIQSPVVAGKDTLVKSTSLKVQELKWNNSPLNTTSLSKAVKKMTTANELVLKYQWKGKTYYKALKKINVLEPVFGE
jgi:Na+-transporting NADH:ubiquinone oxidoreductase subunit NqrB